MIASSAGCLIYFGDDDDDCLFGGSSFDQAGAEPVPALGLRNPMTGQCEFFGGGGGGGGGCNDACGPCAELAEADPAPLPSWGYCESECTYLDEATCLATSGCRGVYNALGDHFECWSTDMSGPIQGGSCEGLDARECSMHDDCTAIHASSCDGAAEEPQPPDELACTLAEFLSCANEPQREPGLCFGEVVCDLAEPGCPPNSIPGREDGCWTGACILVEDCEPSPLN